MPSLVYLSRCLREATPLSEDSEASPERRVTRWYRPRRAKARALRPRLGNRRVRRQSGRLLEREGDTATSRRFEMFASLSQQPVAANQINKFKAKWYGWKYSLLWAT